MANTRCGNMHYVDSTGTLTTKLEDRISGVIVTATSANATFVLQTNSASETIVDLRGPATHTSYYYDFSEHHLTFGIKGVKVSTITNCVATIIYSQNAGGQAGGL